MFCGVSAPRSGSNEGSSLNSKPADGKKSQICCNSPNLIGGCTFRSDTKLFTFVLNTGRCSQGPNDWSMWA